MSAPEASGFALIEVLVATCVLATGVVGTAELFTLAERSVEQARAQTWAVMLASDKLEQLRALKWAYDADGVPLSDLTTDVAVAPPVPGGTGLGPSPDGSLSRSVAGAVDYVDAAGNWVGTGTTPPASAVYVRRWSVTPLPSSPTDALVFQVRVTAVSHASVPLPAGATGGSADDAVLATIEMRTGAP